MLGFFEDVLLVVNIVLLIEYEWLGIVGICRMCLLI